MRTQATKVPLAKKREHKILPYGLFGRSNKATRDHFVVYTGAFPSIQCCWMRHFLCLACVLWHCTVGSENRRTLDWLGVLFLLGQYSTFSSLTNRFGLFSTQLLKWWLVLTSTPLPFIIAFSTFINGGEQSPSGNTNHKCPPYSTANLVYNIKVSVFFASITHCGEISNC
jgi:hypothetical protein